MGGDTWACQALNTEGNRELLVGVEVPRISANFPKIDLRKATLHFPKLVHSLENGLGIYEIRLLASDPHITAAIAGPHPSFHALRKKIGNTGATLATFTKGLDHWKLFGPSPIKSM